VFPDGSKVLLSKNILFSVNQIKNKYINMIGVIQIFEEYKSNEEGSYP
jgi:hypothetical protein